MATTQDQAKELCSSSEWNTVVNSFAPRVSELTPAVLKKQAARVSRFLEKEKAAPGAAGRVALFEEALKRFEDARPSNEGENEKLAARRVKEQAARDREKAVRDRRGEVKTKLHEKAEKEKLEKEGPPKELDEEKKVGKGVRAHLQAAGAQRKASENEG